MFDVHGSAVVPDIETLHPLGDRVVIRPIEDSDRTTSGMLIKPDIAKEAPQRGLVLAVGPGRMTDDGTVLPMPVSVGDVVIYGKYSGTRLVVNGEELLTIRSTDVSARVTTRPALQAVAA